jgi:pterin-4a-carbinolamine dehydratase
MTAHAQGPDPAGRGPAPIRESDWKVQGNALVREVAFRDYDDAMRFIEHLADAAVDYERRPDVSIVEFNTVRIVVSNLHHAGITEAEKRLAAKVDAVVDGYRARTRT